MQRHTRTSTPPFPTHQLRLGEPGAHTREPSVRWPGGVAFRHHVHPVRCSSSSSSREVTFDLGGGPTVRAGGVERHRGRRHSGCWSGHAEEGVVARECWGRIWW